MIALCHPTLDVEDWVSFLSLLGGSRQYWPRVLSSALNLNNVRENSEPASIAPQMVAYLAPTLECRQIKQIVMWKPLSSRDSIDLYFPPASRVVTC
ncbi:hypothetical protein RRG08_038896 [Elysia crispata]|uniref:Uncharacterized protein n=1 Tax=Elysia crispata TaxID=231223 RepID=A0AAE1CU48_9GAST|nr:hypothetical protein RRG08_038896 [Elysia crispata]